LFEEKFDCFCEDLIVLDIGCGNGFVVIFLFLKKYVKDIKKV